MKSRHKHRAASWIADEEWNAELARVFGASGPSVERYLPEGRGEPGSNLRRLYNTRLSALHNERGMWRAFHAVQSRAN